MPCRARTGPLGSNKYPDLSDDWAPSRDEESLKPPPLLNVKFDLAARFSFAPVCTSTRLRTYLSMLEGRLTLPVDK